MTPTVQAKEWEDVSYYFLPHRMKRVFGLDGKGLVFAGTAFDMEKFISSILAEARKETLKEIEGIIENMENYREYTPREDMFGVGWEQMKSDILSALKEKI